MNSDNYLPDGQVRNYSKNQIILYQAEETRNLFIIQKGYVKVYDITSGGNEKMLIILGPGDLFPLVWTFNVSDKMHYFYESISNVSINVIPRSEYLSELNENSKLASFSLKYFVERIHQLYRRIECLEATNAIYKVAQVLQYLTESHSKKQADGHYKVLVPLTHQNIADMAGLSRETTNLQLKDLTKKKVLIKNQSNMVIDTEKLEKFIEKE